LSKLWYRILVVADYWATGLLVKNNLVLA